tara:strand:- start:2131 stop:2766 length:636 start_codon:yes stop_codon:yes gene_type:complete
MDDYHSMTVVQLKEILKEKGLPISGNKSQLISRLQAIPESISIEEESDDKTDVKREITCYKCNQALRVPFDYTGRAKCTSCGLTFAVKGISLEGSTISNKSRTIEEMEQEIIMLRAQRQDDNFLWSHFFLGMCSPYLIYFLFYVFGAMTDSYIFMECGLWISPLSSIGIGLYGFAIGNRALGTGTLVGAILLPLIFFMGCFVFIWFMFEGF